MTPDTLANAVRAAIAHGNTLSDIKPEKWAETFHCESEAVRGEFERQLAEVAE